jgi:hypothetical protein
VQQLQILELAVAAEVAVLERMESAQVGMLLLVVLV